MRITSTFTVCNLRPRNHGDGPVQPLHKQQLCGGGHPRPLLCPHPVWICLLPLQAQVSATLAGNPGEIKNANVHLWHNLDVFKKCGWFDVPADKTLFIYLSINSELEVEQFTEGRYSENLHWDMSFYYFTRDAKGARFVRKTATSPFRGGHRYMNVPNFCPGATLNIWGRL